MDEFRAGGVGGADWATGTRWAPLTTDEVAIAEARFGRPFPPDYREFLVELGTTTPPRPGARFVGAELVPIERPGLYDWIRGEAAIRAALEDVVDGLVFDVEHNGLWDDDWGRRPADIVACARIVREQVAAAPPLIPLFGHRFLVGEPCAAGNPVLSIMQSDIIVYGPDLESWLALELLGIPVPAHDTPRVTFWEEL